MNEITLNRDNFEKEVLKSDKPVVVDFWAPWCTPCNIMGPIIRDLAEESDGKFIVGKVNIDKEDELSERFSIMSIPTIKIFKNGKIVSSLLGVTSQGKILEKLEAL